MLSERLQRQVDQLMDRAEQSAASDDWSQVREICARVLAIDPENADARGFALMAAATPDAAAAVLPDTSGADIGAFVAEIEAPALQLPDSYVEGRYQVRGFLGEGGRKQVYLAHDTRLDRDVAFALIKTDLPPSFVPRFKLVLGRLAAAGRLRAAAPRGWVGRGAGSRGRCGAAAGCIPAASVR